MIETIAETRDRKTGFAAGPSWLAEWSGKQILCRLERWKDLSGEAVQDFFCHDSQPEANARDIVLHSDFWEPRVYYVDIKVEPATENSTHARRTYEESLVEYRNAVSRFPSSLGAHEDEEVVDWDSYIAVTPAPRQSWTIRSRFRYVGRSKPMRGEDL